jgi:uncharacterized membrane protein
MSTDAARANGSGPEEKLATALGWASLGLGVPQTFAPRAFDRLIGVKPDLQSRAWTRVVGLREHLAAAGILAIERPRPVGFVWSRVAGDVKDLALLRNAWRSKRQQPGRLAAAIAAVIGITALDLFTAVRLTRKVEESEQGEAKPMRVKAGITVRKPIDEVYRFWHDFENFPSFMAHLESVEVQDRGRSHWVAKAPPPAGTVEWDAEVVEDRANELIAWRALEGSSVDNRGSVRFAAAPGDRGTEVHVDLEYDPPGGAVGAVVAKLFGEEPSMQVKDDLRRFKQVLEVGEVVRSEGSPEGQLARRQLKQRPAHPVDEPIAAEGSQS